jgi:hypothetical protein
VRDLFVLNTDQLDVLLDFLHLFLRLTDFLAESVILILNGAILFQKSFDLFLEGLYHESIHVLDMIGGYL